MSLGDYSSFGIMDVPYFHPFIRTIIRSPLSIMLWFLNDFWMVAMLYMLFGQLFACITVAFQDHQQKLSIESCKQITEMESGKIFFDVTAYIVWGEKASTYGLLRIGLRWYDTNSWSSVLSTIYKTPFWRSVWRDITKKKSIIFHIGLTVDMPHFSSHSSSF